MLQGALPLDEHGLEDPVASMRYLGELAGVGAASRVLDAGCGVAGPAVILAETFPTVAIDGVTISGRQVEVGTERIRAAGLAERVRLHEADYHDLPFEDGTFDLVLFLEVTGYSPDLEVLYREARRVTSAGGRVFVKDVFRRAGLSHQEEEDMAAFDELWGCLRSPTIDETTTAMANAGWRDVEVVRFRRVGTDHIVGAMFDVADDGLRLNGFGEHFFRTFATLPIEVVAITAKA